MDAWATSCTAAALQVVLDRVAHRGAFNILMGKPDYVKEELLKQLHRQLLSARAVLGDAEEEKIINPIVKEWVDMLQDVIGDAENLLDEIVTNTDCILDWLKGSVNSVNQRLEKINNRLTDLVDLKNKLGLQEGGRERESPLSLPTTRYPDESELPHGRDSDKKIIIEKLKSAHSNRERVTVVAIVGMAGIGKTTLSQHVFHDPQLNGTFKLKSWIHVSDRSNVLDLTKKIYCSVTSSYTEITDLDLLQQKLSYRLMGRKFLLVLDDFWSEKPHEWDLIKRPLTMGAPGSAIIVTTRIENAAHAVRAALTHHLPLLDDENCSRIFFHQAFRNNEGADANETLREIGMQIAGKCKGLPLSARVLGSLLHSTTDAQKWDAILNSKMWDLPAEKNAIVPALRVSYRHLPSHLKRCFAFCSIIPKGYVFSKWILIFLWIAHDLVQSKDGKTVERVGDEYFQELLSRSFLQRFKRNDRRSLRQRSSSGNYSRSFPLRSTSFQQRSSSNDLRPFLPASTNNDSDFVIHDLMNELAQCMGGDIFYRFEGGDLNDIPQKLRHLSFLRDKIYAPVQFEAFHNLSQLRTFLPVTPPESSRHSSSLTDGSLEFLLQNLQSLRVFSLSNFSISVLPDSIKTLMHLRFLNLSGTKIEKLPDLSLPNLVTLLLSECDSLTHLPTNLANLTTLRHLDVRGTLLTQMPPSFRKLKSLQMLTTFFASKDTNASRISELRGLTQLCDTLSIVNLQNVLHSTEASNAKLKEMKFLKELSLNWTETIPIAAQQKEVLQNLEPHKFLQKLKIERYGGREFPEWLGFTSFSNMVSIYLIECSHCSSLPPLGQLCSLKALHIASMGSLRTVNAEFYGASEGTSFRSLKTLSFEKMPEWTEWPRARFPSLQELHIEGCPNLTGDLNHQMPLLNKLRIWECSRLQLFPVEHGALQAVEYLDLRCSCETLESFLLSSFPKLLDLRIQSCPNLQSISIPPQFQQYHDFFENLELVDCQKFHSLLFLDGLISRLLP